MRWRWGAMRTERGAGRRRQSVAASSFDAWIKFYKPDANAGNAVVSYYAKGALIALCLDLKLRLETGGAATLDDRVYALTFLELHQTSLPTTWVTLSQWFSHYAT
mgnify:CR=1 FL=1